MARADDIRREVEALLLDVENSYARGVHMSAPPMELTTGPIRLLGIVLPDLVRLADAAERIATALEAGAGGTEQN